MVLVEELDNPTRLAVLFFAAVVGIGGPVSHLMLRFHYEKQLRNKVASLLRPEWIDNDIADRDEVTGRGNDIADRASRDEVTTSRIVSAEYFGGDKDGSYILVYLELVEQAGNEAAGSAPAEGEGVGPTASPSQVGMSGGSESVAGRDERGAASPSQVGMRIYVDVD